MDYHYPSNIVLDANCTISSIICSTSRLAPVTADVYNSTRQLPAVWDMLLPANSKLTMRYLAYIERSAILGLSFYYVVVKKGDKPVGIIYFQRLTLTKEHYPDFSNVNAIAAQVYKYVSNREFGLLSTGHLFYTGYPWYHFDDKEVKAEEFFRAVNKTATSLLSSTNSHMVMVKDADARISGYLEKKPSGFVHMGEDIFMQMPINPAWQTFDDYVAALGKKYAARVRKMKQAMQAITVRKLSVEEIERMQPQIEDLYLQVISHSSVKIGVLNAQYFLNMKKALGNDFEIFGWFAGDRMVAFVSSLMENGSCEIYYIGYSDEDNRTYSLYPNILLYGIEQSIINHKKLLKFGRTALEAKAIAGGQPLYINNYIKMKNRLLQLGLGFMLKIFLTERGNEWKKRNPFKK